MTIRPSASASATRCRRLPSPNCRKIPSDWLPVFQAAGYFEQAGFSREDQLRAGFYKANALRAAQMERIGDHDDYLRSLGMTLSIAPFDERRPQADCATDLEIEPVQPDHPPLQRSRNRGAAVEARRLSRYRRGLRISSATTA